MNGAFYIGATALQAQQRALDVVANNIANINTTGFKRTAVKFSELVAPVSADAEVARLERDQNAAGVTLASSSRVWTQGDIRATGQAMDIAIDGEGFIELLGPAGQGLLWRGGQLTVNRDGYLAASDGLPLRDLISVPIGAASVTITPDGTVMAQIDENGETERLGKIDLVLAKDKGALEAFGAGYFLSADEQNLINAAPDEAGAGRLVQGSLEGANVELTDEMVSLLLMQRAYSANAQVVQAGDQLMSILNNLRR